MTELQWILLGTGLAVMALITLWHLRDTSNSSRRRDSRLSGREPSLNQRSELEPEVQQDGHRMVLIDPALRDVENPRYVRSDPLQPEQADTPDPVKTPEASAPIQTTVPPPEPVDDIDSTPNETPSLTPVETPEVTKEAPKKAEVPVEEAPTGPTNITESAATLPPTPPAEAPPSPPQKEAPKAKLPSAAPETTFVFTLRADQGTFFNGVDILQTAHNANLRLSRKGVLDYLIGDDSGSPKRLFSIGQLREPGTFNLDQIETLQTPALVFFIQLPTALDAVSAIDRMLAVSYRMAKTLGGQITDPSGKVLTPHGMARLRDRADEFEQRYQRWLNQQPD